MYELKDFDPKDLIKIKIKNQDKIVELTGSKLDPKKAFEIIKKETKDFKLDDEKARQADTLFIELLRREGLVNGSTKKESDQLRIQAEALALELELLELELQLTT